MYHKWSEQVAWMSSFCDILLRFPEENKKTAGGTINATSVTDGRCDGWVTVRDGERRLNWMGGRCASGSAQNHTICCERRSAAGLRWATGEDDANNNINEEALLRWCCVAALSIRRQRVRSRNDSLDPAQCFPLICLRPK
jgi:hypothetical protein